MKSKTLMAIAFLAFVFLATQMSFGQASQVSYGWAKALGGSESDEGNGVAIDSSGNIYVTGYFQGTVNFGLDFGVTDNKTSAGAEDVFITKINADGSYGWTKIIGGTGADIGNGIAINSSDAIFVLGNITGTVDFGLDFGRTDIKTPQGDAVGPFVTKIDSNGTYNWTKLTGGSEGYAITVDSSDNIFATGYFTGTYNFGSDWGSTDNKTSAGNADVFILKINAIGSYGWTLRIGGTGDERGWALAADSSGMVFLTGFYGGSVNFGQDFGTTDNKTSAGGADIFITKFHTTGFYQWTKSIGGTEDDRGYAIASSPSGDIFVTGLYQGTVNFRLDFGGTDNKTAAGSFDIFVTKISSSGTYGWTKVAGDSGWDWGNGITLDPSGNIYTAGRFAGTVNFAQDFGATDNKTAAGNNDIFITKINANGTYGWTKIFGGTSSDVAKGVTIDASGNILGTGYFAGTVNFGLDFGTTDQKTSAGQGDVFVLRLKANRGYYVLDGYGGVHAGGNAQAMAPATPYFGWDIAQDLELVATTTGFYVLDGYGGVHAGGGASAMSPAAPYFGWNIARDLELGTTIGYYVLDGYGGVHSGGGAAAMSPAAPYFGWDIARDLELAQATSTYYVLDGYGGVHSGGGAAAMNPAPPYFGWDIARDLELAGTGCYVLDGYGGLHIGGGAAAMSPATPYFGWDIALDLELAPVGFYVLDGYGGVHAGGGAKKIIPHSPYFGWNIARALALYLR